MSSRRVVLAGLAGGLAWTVWSVVVHVLILGPRYAAAQASELLLAQPRWPFFLGLWTIVLFMLALAVAWLYAAVAARLGSGLASGVATGAVVGFAAGFPANLALMAWTPVPLEFPLWWLAELWLGAIVAGVVAAAVDPRR